MHWSFIYVTYVRPKTVEIKYENSLIVIIWYPFKSDLSNFFQSIMGEVLVEDETIDSIKTRLKHCLKVAYSKQKVDYYAMEFWAWIGYLIDYERQKQLKQSLSLNFRSGIETNENSIKCPFGNRYLSCTSCLIFSKSV